MVKEEMKRYVTPWKMTIGNKVVLLKLWLKYRLLDTKKPSIVWCDDNLTNQRFVFNFPKQLLKVRWHLWFVRSIHIFIWVPPNPIFTLLNAYHYLQVCSITCTIFLLCNAQLNLQCMCVVYGRDSIKLCWNHICKHTNIRLINEQMKEKNSHIRCLWSMVKFQVNLLQQWTRINWKWATKWLPWNEAVDKRIQKHNYTHAHT